MQDSPSVRKRLLRLDHSVQRAALVKFDRALVVLNRAAHGDGVADRQRFRAFAGQTVALHRVVGQTCLLYTSDAADE